MHLEWVSAFPVVTGDVHCRRRRKIDGTTVKEKVKEMVEDHRLVRDAKIKDTKSVMQVERNVC